MKIDIVIKIHIVRPHKVIVVGSRWQAEYRMRCHLEPAVGGSDLAKMASGIAIKGSSLDSRWEKIYNLGTKTGLKPESSN